MPDAHPEPRSLNGALRDHGLRTLHHLGHPTRRSDLYAMDSNPLIGPGDFGHERPAARRGQAADTPTTIPRLPGADRARTRRGGGRDPVAA